MILAAQSTVTQAAADGARAGIVQGTGTTSCNGHTVSAAGCAAVQQASTDLGWMNKGTCYQTVNSTPVGGTSGNPISCAATTVACPSNAVNTCLSLTVSYNYGSAPLFPSCPVSV